MYFNISHDKLMKILKDDYLNKEFVNYLIKTYANEQMDDYVHKYFCKSQTMHPSLILSLIKIYENENENNNKDKKDDDDAESKKEYPFGGCHCSGYFEDGLQKVLIHMIKYVDFEKHYKDWIELLLYLRGDIHFFGG